MLRRLAPAKINLALHVTGQRADGLHLLDSLVCFADFGDEITVAAAESLSLKVAGPMAAHVPVGPDNLILQAAGLFGSGQGARLRLQKNLPVASGIGGGSSDAAAALNLLGALWGEALPEQAKLLELGADIPVCMAGETVRMQGVGEALTPVTMPVLDAVLVNPGVGVSTQKVFQQLESKENNSMQRLPGSKKFTDWVIYLATQRNDLQAAAISLLPAIAQVIEALDCADDCQLARMSGSGATCFGLFPSGEAANHAADVLTLNHPNWWVKAVRLGVQGPWILPEHSPVSE
ncbi:MAG: 4-(cytidine 5'-diphospho)-2-C-methyl-D-erythritol kinase [Alphaproteobacteria bacterium]|nr:4-(cytidine 5'-diphospho)-2-C-methyl-D-erythritol kinase [Alphaproteobacteria bacterium]